ncbi:MAG: Ig-like domain-containing protein [Candidatus Neomarinimicrobiota bacterium]
MNNKIRLLVTIAIVSMVLIQVWDCAAAKPPPGGPEDKTPPELLSATPPGETVNLEDRQITLRFTEYLDPSSIENGFKLLPGNAGDLIVKYRGNKVRITLPDDLDSNRTYIVSLSRDIKDEHGVTLGQSVQLAYSSGSTIHSGKIQGRVPNADRVSVQLWRLTDNLPDSLFRTKSDYTTDVGEDRSYEFRYLAPGSYRILAVGKEMAGLPLDPLRARYGVHWDDPLVIDSTESITGVDLLVRKENEPFRLARGEWTVPGWGRLVFNQSFRKHELDFEIRLVFGDDEYLLPEFFIDPVDSSALVILIADSIETDDISIEVRDLDDTDDLILESGKVRVKKPAGIDTAYVQIVEPATKFMKIMPESVGKPGVVIAFSKPLKFDDDPPFEFNLFDEDSMLIDNSVKWNNPMSFSIFPKDQWKASENYSLTLNRADFVALDGSSLADSVVVIQIRTGKKIGYGTVQGRLNKTPGNNVYASIQSVKNPTKKYASVVNSQDQFLVNKIPEELYLLNLYEDSDSSGSFTFGTAYPFHTSEWFYWMPDTFEVRTNWELELPVIELKESK